MSNPHFKRERLWWLRFRRLAFNNRPTKSESSSQLNSLSTQIDSTKNEPCKTWRRVLCLLHHFQLKLIQIRLKAIESVLTFYRTSEAGSTLRLRPVTTRCTSHSRSSFSVSFTVMTSRCNSSNNSSYNIRSCCEGEHVIATKRN